MCYSYVIVKEVCREKLTFYDYLEGKTEKKRKIKEMCERVAEICINIQPIGQLNT